MRRKNNEKYERESGGRELERSEKERKMIVKIDGRERVAREMREKVKRYRKERVMIKMKV